MLVFNLFNLVSYSHIVFYSVVTQSKSLVGDSSIIFSPPSIVAETLHDDTVFESRKSSVGQCNTKFQVARQL